MKRVSFNVLLWFCRLVIAYRQGTVHSFFSTLTDLYHQRQLFSPKKFVEQFSNGVTIVSVYLRPIPLDTPEGALGRSLFVSVGPTEACVCVRSTEEGEAVVDERMNLVVRDAALLYCLARTALTPLFSVSKAASNSVSVAEYGFGAGGNPERRGGDVCVRGLEVRPPVPQQVQEGILRLAQVRRAGMNDAYT